MVGRPHTLAIGDRPLLQTARRGRILGKKGDQGSGRTAPSRIKLTAEIALPRSAGCMTGNCSLGWRAHSNPLDRDHAPHAHAQTMSPVPESGLQAVFIANRDKLLRFLMAQGAGQAAEDLLQELWIRVSTTPAAPIARPLSYLYRAANNLMLDRYRSTQQAVRRDANWVEAQSRDPEISETPSGERSLIAREQLLLAERTLDALGPRVATAFRRHRLDGVPQKVIARELDVSLSTVEADLRKAYRAMIELRRMFDEA
jgi:RNA polymerase sigma factor (sigma-70 family)